MPQNMKSSDRFRTVFDSAVLCQLFQAPYTLLFFLIHKNTFIYYLAKKKLPIYKKGKKDLAQGSRKSWLLRLYLGLAWSRMVVKMSKQLRILAFFLEWSQYKNDLGWLNSFLVFKLPPFSLTYRVRDKRREISKKKVFQLPWVVLILSLL